IWGGKCALPSTPLLIFLQLPIVKQPQQPKGVLHRHGFPCPAPDVGVGCCLPIQHPLPDIVHPLPLHDPVSDPQLEFVVAEVIHDAETTPLHPLECRPHFETEGLVELPAGVPLLPELVSLSLPAALRELDDLCCHFGCPLFWTEIYRAPTQMSMHSSKWHS